jgi:hypothetical protein
VARLEVERQRDRAELQIEVDQDHAPPPLVGDQPGDAGRERGRADPAARAADRDQAAELLAALDHAALVARREDRLLQERRRDRLDQVVGDAVLQQVAEQAAVVARPERQHGHPGLAHVGQAVDVGQRQLGVAEVDHQQLGRALLAEVLDRVRDGALADRGMGQHQLADHLVDDGVGLFIGDEGEELLTLFRVRLLGRCDCGRH